MDIKKILKSSLPVFIIPYVTFLFPNSVLCKVDTVFIDDFEIDKNWTVNPFSTDNATAGIWERGNPEPTSYNGISFQLGITVSGCHDLVTGAFSGSSVGSNDIDGGVTSIQSPDITIPQNGEIEIFFSYYFSHYSNSSINDFLKISIIGQTTEIIIENFGASSIREGQWLNFSADLNNFKCQTVYILIEASDGGEASLVEAGVDNVLITSVVEPLVIKTTFKGLLLLYDPYIYDQELQYRKITDIWNWEVNQLIADYFTAFFEVSGGQVSWELVDTIELDEFPPETDPLTDHTRENYFGHYDSNPKIGIRSGYADYKTIILDERFDIVSKVESGEIDHLIIMPPPICGFWESAMAGQGAYPVNGGLVSGINSTKKFLIFGPTYERGLGESLHAASHMTESILGHINLGWPKNWSYNVYNDLNLQNPNRMLIERKGTDWEKFVLTDAINHFPFQVSPGNSQVGRTHYPPNAMRNYDWPGIDGIYQWSVPEVFKIYGDSSKWHITREQPIYAEADNGSKILFNEFTWFGSNVLYSCSDFTAEIDIKVQNSFSSSSAGFLFRMTEFGEGENSGKGYYIGISTFDQEVFLAKINNGFEILRASDYPIKANQYHRIKVKALGENISVQVDGMNTPLFSFQDQDFHTGGLGFTNYNTDVHFKDIIVNATVESYADSWYDYPDLSAPPKKTNSNNWSKDHAEMMKWWFEHIPKNNGLHSAVDLNTQQEISGILNTWWPYIFDLNTFCASAGYTDVIFPPEDNIAPDPPLNVGFKPTNSTIQLSWKKPNDNIGVTRYEIYRDGNFLQKTSRTGFTDRDLSEGTEYTYVIKAQDGTGNLSEGIEIKATTLTDWTTVYSDDFESDKNWQVNPSGSDNATTGLWERANPEPTSYNGINYQLDNTASGGFCLVTGALAGASVGSNDIDGGLTSIGSPTIGLPFDSEIIKLSFKYYLSHYDNSDNSDFLRIKIIGNTATQLFEEICSPDIDEALWAQYEVDITEFHGQFITILIEAADRGAGSLVEAAIDDVVIIEKGGIPSNLIDLSEAVASHNASNPQMFGRFPEDLYDDDFSTHGLVNYAHEPVEITFEFPQEITVRGANTYWVAASGNPAYRWSLEAANTLEDLNNGTNSYVILMDNMDTPSDNLSTGNFLPVSLKLFRFTGERLTGDGFVHCNELQLFN